MTTRGTSGRKAPRRSSSIKQKAFVKSHALRARKSKATNKSWTLTAAKKQVTDLMKPITKVLTPKPKKSKAAPLLSPTKKASLKPHKKVKARKTKIVLKAQARPTKETPKRIVKKPARSLSRAGKPSTRLSRKSAPKRGLSKIETQISRGFSELKSKLHKL